MIDYDRGHRGPYGSTEDQIKTLQEKLGLALLALGMHEWTLVCPLCRGLIHEGNHRATCPLAEIEEEAGEFYAEQRDVLENP